MRFFLVAGLGTLPVFLILRLVLDRGLAVAWPWRDGAAATLADGPRRRQLMAWALVRPRPDPVPVLALALALAVLVGLGVDALHADDAGNPLANGLDRAVSAWMQAGRAAALDPIVVGLTSFGDAAVLAAATAALVLALGLQKAWRLALGIAVTMIAARLLVSGLKPLIGIPRPSDLYQGVEAFSFPSGHATMTTTWAGLLFVLTGPGGSVRTLTRVVLAALIAAMLASRLYLGAHWPSDVIAGFLVGLAFSAAFGFAYGPFGPARREIDRALVAACAVALLIGCARLALRLAEGLLFYAPPA